MNVAQSFLQAHRPKEGRALVVGSKIYGQCIDRRTLYREALGLDMLDGEGVDLVHDLEHPLAGDIGQFAHVDCCSVLEHVRRPWLMGANIEAALEAGGTLLVVVPFIWRRHAYPSDYWRFTPEALDVLFPSIQWQSKQLYANGEPVKISPRFNDDAGQRWLARTEVAAFGTKCASTS